MTKHHEVRLEDAICAHLAAHGWLHDPGDAAPFDRARALVPSDLLAWMEATQPAAWEALTKAHGAAAATLLLDRLRAQLDARGTLDVLRHGIEVAGVRGTLRLAQFRPAMGLNAATLAAFGANRLRVLRQVRYSVASERSLGLVLALNGVPVATVELKTDFTQGIEDAVDQYRFDRHPHPKGQAREPLLAFPSGALVHFAASDSAVRMTTRLDGAATRFLPFDKGCDGAAGNPPNPDGHPSAYLWEEVWARESWLDILGHYMVAQKDKKRQVAGLVFPRYHQLDATRRLVAAIRAEGAGAGGRYLVQHSAGSGKTNSIAWTAHLLADLHDADDRKVFDSVLVVSDRNVIDAQLREAIFAFERTGGVVATITSEKGAKSGQLAQAIARGKKVVVCTIQTFPFALAEVRALAASEGKRFAVIADEAHSSQAGEASAKLREVLSPEEADALADGGEVSTEDLLLAQAGARAADGGFERDITFVAFTATPKAKTLELFGSRPDPAAPAGPGNLPRPFHVYSMRQAIEEGFILDVLRNFTPYKLAFRLATEAGEVSDAEVERSEALRTLMRWVRLHPYNIAQKVEVVVEHYRAVVQPLLGGRAKAMVVVGSRLEAVRWQLALRRYIAAKGYGLGALVAFSGEVVDPESGPGPLTEASASLNPGLGGRDIRDAFALPENHVLLVANKFQTGFDQPLLCGMYVDRRLAGIQAVQTLSRLNRAWQEDGLVKDATYVLDFVNDEAEILGAFQAYHETATLAGVTDLNLPFDMRAKLDATGYYDEAEVGRVVQAELDPAATHGDLVRAIYPVADRLLKLHADATARRRRALAEGAGKAATKAQDQADALLLFKGDLGAFLRAYGFLSQIFDYASTTLEARSLFFRRLLPLLEFGRERVGVDTSKVVLTHHRLAGGKAKSLNLGGGSEPLQPMTEAGSGALRDKEKALLAEIVEKLNDLFQGDVTDDDRLVYVNDVLKGKLLANETLARQAASNSKAQFTNSPVLADAFLDAVVSAFEAHSTMSRQALDSAEVRNGLKDVLLGPGRLYEALRCGGLSP